MSDELPAALAARLSKVRIRDPQKAKRRAEVDARNQLMQKKGVPAPVSGTFGAHKKVGEKK